MIKTCSATITLVVLIALAGTAAHADTIIFSEQSSSNLEVTLGGSPFGTVSPFAPSTPQFWDWDPPFSIDGKTFEFFTIRPTIFWLEPGGDLLGSGPWNAIGNNGFTGMMVSSDRIQAVGNPGQAVLDSTIVPKYITLHLTDGSTTTDYTIDYDVQFVDLANDPTPVPEPSTILLLGSGLIGLVGYGRKRLFKK